MAWCWDEELHVVVHTNRDPTDAEWDRYVAELQSFNGKPDRKILVYSSGGGPNGRQRHALSKTLRGHPVALVTSSPIMRAMGVVLHALDPSIRVIAPTDEDLAFEHLRLSQAQRRRARLLRDDLAQRVAADLAIG